MPINCPCCGSSKVIQLGDTWAKQVWYYCKICKAVSPKAPTLEEAKKLWQNGSMPTNVK